MCWSLKERAKPFYYVDSKRELWEVEENSPRTGPGTLLVPSRTICDSANVCCSESGPQTSSTSFLWDLLRNAESQTPPQTYRTCIWHSAQVICEHSKIWGAWVKQKYYGAFKDSENRDLARHWEHTETKKMISAPICTFTFHPHSHSLILSLQTGFISFVRPHTENKAAECSYIFTLSKSRIETLIS